MPDLNETLEQIASEPAAVTIDGQSATNLKPTEVIAAIKHVAAANAVSGPNANGGARSGWRGLRPARAIPPGAV